MAREDPGAYLPIDRLHAIARGEALPASTSGSALFADVSGFTPLTEALVRTLGPRRGAEELGRQLNLVYDALVAEAHSYGGSVIAFSGDAVTCWFDGDDGRRAAACALDMHGALARVGTIFLPTGGKVTLAMKVAVASGPARRFVVGDPSLRLLDVLAGATLERMAAAEQLAHRAEVVLSPECAPALGDDALVLEWRKGGQADSAASYPVVGGLMAPVLPAPWPALPSGSVTAEQLRPWIMPALYEQLTAGQARLQPELRPAAAIFVRFGSIDYDADPGAHAMLDAYIRWVQALLERYGGSLLQLTIGDKGSYFYAIFGAPLAHERYALHAALAALELRTPPPELAAISPVQIGISAGITWAGAYGGSGCRTYGVLGDEVNLAARLMQQAAPGEILVSDQVRRLVASAIQCQLLEPLDIKGKSRPVAVARLLSAWPTAVPAAEAPTPFVGRAAELQWLRERVGPLLAGRFVGVIAVYGEPGIGKSRLIDALRQELSPSLAAGAQPPVSWLSCTAEQLVRSSLHPFRQLLQRFFRQQPELPAAENAARLDAALDALLAELDARGAAPVCATLDEARPFLAALLGLPTPEGWSERIEPEQRLDAAMAAIVTLIRAECLRRPVLLHVEDASWLDPDSLALFRTLARDAAGHPLAMLLSSRYDHDDEPAALHLDPTTPHASLELGGLDGAAVRELAAETLGEHVDGALADFLSAKTSGNPLFVEQLILDLRERGALAARKGRQQQGDAPPLFALGSGRLPPRLDEVPASITAVLIARLDRLHPEAKLAAQLAAVLGQEFDLQVLAQMCGPDPRLAAGVRQATAQGIWAPAGEGRYRFRHGLLRDAAYQMQLHSQLRELHRLAASAIEQVYGEGLAAHVGDLAQHAQLGGDQQRERRYVALLGEQAFNISSFREAIACYERAIELTAAEAPAERGRLLARLARAHALLGHGEEARRLYEQSLALAQAAGDPKLSADACFELGGLARRRADYDGAREALERALAFYAEAGDTSGQGRALNLLGSVYIELGEAEKALDYYQQALSLGRRERRRR